MSAANLERSDMKKQFRKLTVEEADALFVSGVDLRFIVAKYNVPDPEQAVGLHIGTGQSSPSEISSRYDACHYWAEVE